MENQDIRMALDRYWAASAAGNSESAWNALEEEEEQGDI